MEAAYDTRIVAFGARGIADGAALIRAGQPVAVASETVYGLAGDATNGEAVARIYDAKGRPQFNPLIVHVLDLAAAEEFALFDPVTRRLAARFWPGPLTIVLPLRSGAPISDLATAGLDTVALRVPAHPAMRALIEASGRPLAAPSANASGRISPTTAQHVAASLTGRIPLIIDAGETPHGLESTIVAVEPGGLRLLRPGPIDQVALGAATGVAVKMAAADTITAPGQLVSHYAPAKPLRLNALAAEPGEWLIGFGPVAGDATLSSAGDLIEAAARLFAQLHDADAVPYRAIAVAPIPEHGLGHAINDRLRRAAAPRD